MTRALPPATLPLVALALLLAPAAPRAQDDAPPAIDAPAPAADAPVPPAEVSPAEVSKVPYEVDLTGLEDNGTLRDLLRASSSLVELKDDPPPSVIGLERRADADRDRLETALRSAGYYDGKLDIRVVTDVQPARVTIAVEPGPAYRFKDITLRTESGAPLPGAPITPEDLGLKPGERARAPEVVAAQARLVAMLTERGYAFAKVPDRRAVVDHTDQSMDVTFTVDPGPLAHFGATRVEGAEQVDEDLIRGRLPWEPGERYDPALVERARADIAKLGVFDTVRVQLAEEPGPGGVVPVTVFVSERKRHVIGAGVAYSTTEGVGANAYWGHRNLFGGAEQLRLSVEVGRLAGDTSSAGTLDLPDLRFGANFRKPDFLAPRQSLLLDFSVVADRPPAYERVAGILTAAVEREITDQLKVSAGVTSERGRVRTIDRTYQVSLVGLPVTAAYDTTDSLLNPVKGFRLGAAVTPWFPVGGNESSQRFVATSLSGSTYYDIAGDGRYVAAARLGLGSIVGAGLAAIPPDRRFYAGGGGSVRGYGFQKAGPRNRADDPVGGRSLVEAGVEMRIKVTDTIGVVPFLDAGTVSDSSFPSFRETPRFGAGLGLRYYTDFGPLRVDVGVPLNPERGDSRWQLYLSLGQAF